MGVGAGEEDAGDKDREKFLPLIYLSRSKERPSERRLDSNQENRLRTGSCDVCRRCSGCGGTMGYHDGKLPIGKHDVLKVSSGLFNPDRTRGSGKGICRMGEYRGRSGFSSDAVTTFRLMIVAERGLSACYVKATISGTSSSCRSWEFLAACGGYQPQIQCS